MGLLNLKRVRDSGLLPLRPRLTLRPSALPRQVLLKAMRAAFARSLGCIVLAASLSSCGGDGSVAPSPAPVPPPAPTLPPAPVAFRVNDPAAILPANCDGVPARGTLYVGAEVEPHVAASATNTLQLVGAWQQDRWSNGGARGISAAWSADGGTTWSRSTPAFTRCTGGDAAAGTDFERATDPWVTIAADGTVYLMALAFNGAMMSTGSANAMLVARSLDGGRTWARPSALIRDGAAAFNDKNTITADPLDARYVYAVWDRISGDLAPTFFARSADAGTTWEAARAIYDPGPGNQTIGNLIVVVPAGPARGTLVNVFTEIIVNEPTIRVIRSTDKGATWSVPVTVGTLQAIGARDPRTSATSIRDGSDLAQAAVGPRGEIYVVWQDARFSTGKVDAIVLSRSDDAGLTWSLPLLVSPRQTSAAFTPQVAVAADGTVAVSFFDFRATTADSPPLQTSAWLAVSGDGGVTWRENRVSGPFDLLTAPNSEKLFLGDYQGLAASGRSFLPFFAQTTGDLTNRTDVFAIPAPAAAATQRVAEQLAAVTAFNAEFAAKVRDNAARNRLLRRANAAPAP